MDDTGDEIKSVDCLNLGEKDYEDAPARRQQAVPILITLQKDGSTWELVRRLCKVDLCSLSSVLLEGAVCEAQKLGLLAALSWSEVCRSQVQVGTISDRVSSLRRSRRGGRSGLRRLRRGGSSFKVDIFRYCVHVCRIILAGYMVFACVRHLR